MRKKEKIFSGKIFTDLDSFHAALGLRKIDWASVGVLKRSVHPAL